MIRLNEVRACLVSFPTPIALPNEIVVVATGIVSSSGWTSPRLVPRIQVAAAPDASRWDFDMAVDQPHGIVLNVELPISAAFIGSVPVGVDKVRVYWDGDYLDAPIETNLNRNTVKAALSNNAVRTIYQRSIASYEDSQQPTGTIHWTNDGPLGSPMPHVEMKKLVHALTLVVEGPDDAKINQCVNDSKTAALLSGLIVGFTTGGMAGIATAGSTFVETLGACLGSGFTPKLQDDSHWVYWDT